MHLNLRVLPLFWSRRRVVLSLFFSTQLSYSIESILWSMFTWRLELRCLEIFNCTVHNQYHISLTWQIFFFLHGKRLFIDLISGGTKLRPRPLNTRQWEAITVSLVYPLAVPSTTPTHAHFILFLVSLASRDKDGDLSNPRIDIYNPTAKQGTVSSLLTECFWTVVSFQSNVICSAYFPKTPLYFVVSLLTRTRLYIISCRINEKPKDGWQVSTYLVHLPSYLIVRCATRVFSGQEEKKEQRRSFWRAVEEHSGYSLVEWKIPQLPLDWFLPVNQ